MRKHLRSGVPVLRACGVWALAAVLLAGPLQANVQVGKVAFSGDNRLSVYSNEVSGPGAASSFLTRHVNFDDQLSLNADWQEGKDVRWSSQLGARFTGDPRVDLNRASLQKLSLDRFSPDRHISMGDFFGSFTQYSLNQNLKGLKWDEENLGGFRTGILAGVAKNRWDDFWERNSAETVDRYVLGAQARRSLPLGSEVGLQVVGSRDDRTAGSTSDWFAQNLIGANWSLPSNSDLSISGESAWSDATITHPAADREIKRGGAHKVSVRSHYKAWRSQEEFENVSPDFVTVVGAAPSDFRRFQTRNQFRIGPNREILFNYNWYRNNLNGQLTDTSKTQSPEAGVRWLGLFNRPSLTVDTKLRYRETWHTSATTPKYTSVGEVLSLSDRFGDVSGDIQYEHRDEKRGGAQKDSRNIVGINLAGFWRLNQAVLRPYIRWNVDDDRDQILNLTNQVTETTLGLATDITPELSNSLSYRRSRIKNATSDSVSRDSFEARFGYNIPRLKGDRIEMGYRNDSNRFSTSSKNYRESVWETTYVHKI